VLELQRGEELLVILSVRGLVRLVEGLGSKLDQLGGE
jgi:hypothetical protein